MQELSTTPLLPVLMSKFESRMTASAHGVDAMAALRAGAAAFESVLASQPSYPDALMGMMVINREVAVYQRQHGQSPEASLIAMILYADRYLKSARDKNNPTDCPPLILAYNMYADLLRRRGSDVLALQGKAQQLAAECFQLNHNFGRCYRALAVGYIAEAEYRYAVGKDVEPALGKAIELLTESARLSPGRIIWRADLARAYALGSQAAVASKRDPSSYQQKLAAAISDCLKLSTANADCYVRSIEYAQTDAVWRLRQGKTMAPALQQGLLAAQEALRRNPQDGRPQAMVGELHYLQAQQQHGSVQAQSIAEGLTRAEQALKLNSNMAEALAVKGRLLLLQIQSLRGPERSAAARRAVDALDQASEAEPLLQRRLAPLLLQARQAAAAGAPAAGPVTSLP